MGIGIVGVTALVTTGIKAQATLRETHKEVNRLYIEWACSMMAEGHTPEEILQEFDRRNAT